MKVWHKDAFRPTCEGLPSGRSVSSDTKINGLVDDLAVVPYLKDKTIHPDNKIDLVQRPVLPFLGCMVYLVRDERDGRCGELYFINLTHLLLNVGYTHSFGVQGYYKLFY